MAARILSALRIVRVIVTQAAFVLAAALIVLAMYLLENPHH